MGVHIRTRNGRLYLDCYASGRRRWEALGLSLGADEGTNRETMRLADILRQKREMQIISGEWGLLDPVNGKRSLLDCAKDLAKEKNPKDRLPKALPYLEEYSKGIQIGAVNERFIEGFQKFLLEKGLSRATASMYESALRQVLNRAVRDLVIPRNPGDAVKAITVPETEKVSLEPEELQKLAATHIPGKFGAEVRRAFLFACLTGFRVSDLRSLAWGQVQRNPLQILKRQEKTGRVVAVPLNESAWKIIKDTRIHGRDEHVFPYLAGSKTSPNQYLTKWATAAGVDKQIGMHTARHTFAVLSLEGGADLFTVSRLMGHTKTATTAVYVKATDKLKRQAVDGLPELDVPEGAQA